jgi:hypothetical protein
VESFTLPKYDYVARFISETHYIKTSCSTTSYIHHQVIFLHTAFQSQFWEFYEQRKSNTVKSTLGVPAKHSPKPARLGVRLSVPSPRPCARANPAVGPACRSGRFPLPSFTQKVQPRNQGRVNFQPTFSRLRHLSHSAPHYVAFRLYQY